MWEQSQVALLLIFYPFSLPLDNFQNFYDLPLTRLLTLFTGGLSHKGRGKYTLVFLPLPLWETSTEALAEGG